MSAPDDSRIINAQRVEFQPFPKAWRSPFYAGFFFTLGATGGIGAVITLGKLVHWIGLL